MVKQGETLIMTVEELREADQALITSTIDKIKEDLNLNFWEQLLTAEKAAEDLGVSKNTIYNWKKLEKHPIPFHGQPERITRKEAREWFRKYSNIYRQS